MQPEPQKEHRWLDQFVGEWTYESTALAADGKDPLTFTGTESVRSLAGIWVVCEGRGEMGADAQTTIMSIGYDVDKREFVGSFVGSMMTHLWVYAGQLDGAGKVLSLDSEGPSFTDDGTMSEYRDELEVISPDYRVMRSSVLQKDGSWLEFMTSHYRRVKQGP